MKVSSFEPDVPKRAADGQAARPGDGDARPEMRASPNGEDEDQRPEESIDEPGYGHGV
jgi:hypothetical protein